MVYNLVASGGTFDHFHKGHEEFLSYGLSMGKNILIGITSDNYVKNSKFNNVNQAESFSIRKQSVVDFLSKTNSLRKSKIISLNDPFGPTLSKDIIIDRLIVSDETANRVNIINEKRREIGLAPIKTLIAPQIFCKDNKLLSSARIRQGEVDRQGEIYMNPSWVNTGLILPDELREKMGKPFGEIVKDVYVFPDAPLVITVGDETTKYFNSKGYGQNISVVDFKIQRKLIFSSILELGFRANDFTIRVSNPAGCISKDSFSKMPEVIEQGIQRRTILQIDGEEDLLVLSLILASPLNSQIFYGQPNKGMVKIVVSEKNKNLAYDLASKFKPIEAHTRGY